MAQRNGNVGPGIPYLDNGAVPRSRYRGVSEEKAGGATYTPPELAGFVAEAMLRAYREGAGRKPVRILDPAVGEGQLLSSLLERLPARWTLEVHGFDSDEAALEMARRKLRNAHARASLHLSRKDFLNGVTSVAPFDLVIANPPYVRTQIMGAANARSLAARFGLTGRVDLYHAFVLGISQVLAPDGVAGIILSNRFMTTRAGAGVREAIRRRFHLEHIWDLGDTKLFDAAVLPAVLVVEGLNGKPRRAPRFTTIYETKAPPRNNALTITEALACEGVVAISDGRRFHVRQGWLDGSQEPRAVWRVATLAGETWLKTAESRAWGTFRRLGRVRVGVKTCADKVFIVKDPEAFSEAERPELLRPLTTHHIARRFRADPSRGQRYIVYPHECVDGDRRPVELESVPRTRVYLERHRRALEGRTYVIEAGREWYEIWVPQDPSAWEKPKLVFRDISEQPCFWVDREQSIVNGDCYWIVCADDADEALLWLAASVGNSTFIEAFYDHKFNNKLYAGRRRFITQYVEQFLLPDPTTRKAKEIVAMAREIHDCVGMASTASLEKELDRLVWKAFGLDAEVAG